MVYDSFDFPTLPNRPFFYTNFVSTVDGKVQVQTKDQGAYWPIGSKTDYETLIELRTFADVLIYGKNSVLSFNHGENLSKEDFKTKRKKHGKDENIIYVIVCNTVKDLALETIRSPHSKYTYLVVPNEAEIKKEMSDAVHIVRIGKKVVDIVLLSQWLQEKQYKHVLVEGGPTLLGSFLAQNLIDEVFLTIAPKIFGNEQGKTLTLVENILFDPEKIKHLNLLSVKQIENELFLRYSVQQ